MPYILAAVALAAAVVCAILWRAAVTAAARAAEQADYELRQAQASAQQAQREATALRATAARLADTEAAVQQAQELLRRGKQDADRRIQDAEERAATAQATADAALQERVTAAVAAAQAAADEQLAALRHELAQAQQQAAPAAGDALLLEVGIYTPTLRFPDAPAYVEALEANAARQAEMVKNGTAAIAMKSWSIGGDAKAGERLAQSLIKLALRAFNGEADAIVARVSWKNLDASLKRLTKTRDTINGLLEKYFITITNDFLELRLDEIRLTQEQAEIEQRIRDEQRELREQMREEAKRVREMEQAKIEAERAERQAAEALAKARAELAKSHAMDTESNRARIAELEAKLSAAQAGKAQVISLAQFTKLGHVYIISNIGSLGDGVVKIGMTRRLDPLDRIDELGDASVPFPFDIHALIRTQDAPRLEGALHERFADRRVNLVNERKEFFQVSLHEVQQACAELGETVQFTMLAAADQYQQSRSLRQRAPDGSTRTATISRDGVVCAATMATGSWAVVQGSGSAPQGTWRAHLHDPLYDLVAQAVAAGWHCESVSPVATLAQATATSVSSAATDEET